MSTTLDRAVPVSAGTQSAPSPEPGRPVPSDLQASRALHGRLNAALAELGLSGALSSRWATPARSGFFFAPHNLHQAARLVLALEHLGESVLEPGVDPAGRRTVDPGPGQLSLPFDAPG
jgi:hypothetical protein